MKLDQMMKAQAEDQKRFGVKPERKLSEDQEHALVMDWARLVKIEGGRLSEFMHHSPNGGKRDAREGAKFKRMGTLAGFPDFQILIARKGYHGLFVELKAKKGIVSDAQKAIAARLNGQGYLCTTAYGFDAVKRIVSDYLELAE